MSFWPLQLNVFKITVRSYKELTNSASSDSILAKYVPVQLWIGQHIQPPLQTLTTTMHFPSKRYIASPAIEHKDMRSLKYVGFPSEKSPVNSASLYSYNQFNCLTHFVGKVFH